MLVANKEHALHKSIMLRVLINVLDDPFLSKNMFFKGGTCASMLGYLDRFSVDLDFDIKDKKFMDHIREALERVIKDLNLEIKDYSKNVIQYYLKYDAPEKTRNTLKIDAVEVPFKNNVYETLLLLEINRYSICQTKETLFTNKLVALVDRYEKSGSIAGRDLYDIHYFLQSGLNYSKGLIEERRGVSAHEYFVYLIKFIEEQVTDTVITQDLNFLLDYKKFSSIRRTLREETVALLRDRLV